eukprot:m51a1_g13643 hypothetical protein (323) ;mRNA; r:186-2018
MGPPVEFDEATIRKERAEVQEMVARAREMRMLPRVFAGSLPRGIALTCGTKFRICLFNLHMIRQVFKVDLPVEVWSGTDELKPRQRALLLKVTDSKGNPPVLRHFEDVSEDYTRWFGPVRHWTPHDWKRNFHYKIMALLGTAFTEVLLLDDDNVPIANPELLFEAQEYKDNGAVFWTDMYMLPRSSQMWAVLELQYREMWAGESGAVLVDKHRSYASLMALALMNQHQDFFYKITYFDKDTFIYAWMAAGDSFYQIPYPPVPVGKMKGDGMGFCGFSFGQNDFTGRLAFVHMTHNKDMQNAVTAAKFFDPEHAEQTCDTPHP